MFLYGGHSWYHCVSICGSMMWIIVGINIDANYCYCLRHNSWFSHILSCGKPWYQCTTIYRSWCWILRGIARYASKCHGPRHVCVVFLCPHLRGAHGISVELFVGHGCRSLGVLTIKVAIYCHGPRHSSLIFLCTYLGVPLYQDATVYGLRMSILRGEWYP